MILFYWKHSNTTHVTISNYFEVNSKSIMFCRYFTINTIDLSRHEQVCLIRLRFEMGEVSWEKYLCDAGKYLSDHGKSMSRNLAYLNILVYDVIKLLYYKH